MLHRSLVRAIGLSVATKESTDRFSSSASLRTRVPSGRPRTDWNTKVPRSKRDENACMTGSTRGRLLRPVLLWG